MPHGRLTAKRTQRLSAEIDALVEAWRPQPHLIEQRDSFIRDFQRHLAAIIPACTAVPFGSAVNGLWLAGSDLDLSVEAPGVSVRADSKLLLRRVGAAIHRIAGDRPEARLLATVPILHWTPSQIGLPRCDISIGNKLAVANSRLVSTYVATDVRLRSLAIALKVWARARVINDRSRGTLSSFALALMLIHLLQQRCLVPDLQALAARLGVPAEEVLGADCRYCTDPIAIAEEVSRLRDSARGAASGSRDTAGALLLAFFKYYSIDYRGGAVAIRESTEEESCKGMQRSGRGNFFFVDNPFQPGRDVANVDARQLVRIREELRFAHSHLARGGSLMDLCATGKEGGAK